MSSTSNSYFNNKKTDLGNELRTSGVHVKCSDNLKKYDLATELRNSSNMTNGVTGNSNLFTKYKVNGSKNLQNSMAQSQGPAQPEGSISGKNGEIKNNSAKPQNTEKYYKKNKKSNNLTGIPNTMTPKGGYNKISFHSNFFYSNQNRYCQVYDRVGFQKGEDIQVACRRGIFCVS